MQCFSNQHVTQIQYSKGLFGKLFFLWREIFVWSQYVQKYWTHIWKGTWQIWKDKDLFPYDGRMLSNSSYRWNYLNLNVTDQNRVVKIYLDWLFMFVLPVALLNDPCSKQAAISFSELTLTSVDPANVITPFDVSRICIGGFPGTVTFPACPFAVSGLFKQGGSSKSRTSSFRIFWQHRIFWLDIYHNNAFY